MFTRYWRTYPWFLQFIQLIILIAVLFFFLVGGVGTVLIPAITGVTLTQSFALDKNSTYAVIQAALISQLLFTLAIFLVPALLFAYFTHPRPAAYLGLRKPGKKVQWLLVLLLFLGAIPLLLQLEGWMSTFNWGASARELQQKNEEVTAALTKMTSTGDFLKVFFVIAILPAIGEELLFRGLFMRFAAKRSRGILFPIIISAVTFAFFHSNIYGFLSIFFAGSLLGFIYYATGSLWCSMMAHLLNNGLQVTLLYMAKNNPSLQKAMDGNALPLPLLLGGLVLCIVSAYLLWKNKTPLAPNWSSDYAPGELTETEIEKETEK